jgi:hypothetical protein
VECRRRCQGLLAGADAAADASGHTRWRSGTPRLKPGERAPDRPRMRIPLVERRNL